MVTEPSINHQNLAGLSTQDLLNKPNGRVFKFKKVKKTGLSTGLYFDKTSITGAMVSCARTGEVHLEALEKLKGHFSTAEEIIQGFTQLKDKLPLGVKEESVSCLSGKNLYVAQKMIKRVPSQEIEDTLRSELKNSLPFDVEKAILDYQFMEPKQHRNQEIDLVVTAVESKLLNHHLGLLNQSGFYPTIVEALPLSLANAHWTIIGSQVSTLPYVIIHNDYDVCTIVISGNHTPLYTKSVYLVNENIPEILKSDAENNQSYTNLGKEISQTLETYTKQHTNSGYAGVLLSGFQNELLPWQKYIAKITQLDVVPLDLASHLGYDLDGVSGEYNIPLVLALRGQG